MQTMRAEGLTSTYGEKTLFDEVLDNNEQSIEDFKNGKTGLSAT